MTKTPTIDNDFYNTLGDRWYTAYDDPVALLRAESRTKAPWVVEKIKKHFGNPGDGGNNIQLLDVGCGAGFLSNLLAQEGLRVTGLDLSEESLKVAAKYDSTKSVKYIAGDAYRLPFGEDSFDVVSAMDFLEHVDDPFKSISEISRVLRPGGIFFFHTFNRNWIANLVVIKAVEKLVKNTPRNMHVIELFITPEELRTYCERAGLTVSEMTGLRPQFTTITLKSLFTGVVPEKLAFQLTPSLKLSYMGYARKETEA